MDLKDQLELELLRLLTRRLVEFVDSRSGYDWRRALRASAATEPMDFSLTVEPGQDIDAALEAAIQRVTARLGIDRRDFPLLH